MSTHLNPPLNPPAKRRNKGKIAAILGAAVAVPVLMLGSCATGAALSSGSSEPQPTKTITAEPEPAPTVTVTAEPVEVEVPVTPPECIEALDLAGRAIDIFSDYPQMVADAANAGFSGTAADIDAITARMARTGEQIEALTPDVQRASTACRASAQ